MFLLNVNHCTSYEESIDDQLQLLQEKVNQMDRFQEKISQMEHLQEQVNQLQQKQERYDAEVLELRQQQASMTGALLMQNDSLCPLLSCRKVREKKG